MPPHRSGRARRRTSVALAGAGALLAAAAAPASAAYLALDDPRGDASGGLDVTRVGIRNGDHGVVVTVKVDGIRKGNVVASIDRRSGLGRTLVTQRKANGMVRTFLLRGSFADPYSDDQVRCPRLTATWDAKASTVRLRMPSGCLYRGNYGALRAVVLTERPGGGDSDLAPEMGEDDVSWTGWVPRG